jgi:hypothetical protein
LALHALGVFGLVTLAALGGRAEETSAPPVTVVVEPAPPVDASATPDASPSAPLAVTTGAAPAPPAPEPAPTGVAAPVTVETAAAGEEARFDLRTRALEVQVDELKEQIFRTKARLASLAESVLEGGYNLSATAKSATAALRGLLGEAAPALSARSRPRLSTEATLRAVVAQQAPHWPCLATREHGAAVDAHFAGLHLASCRLTDVGSGEAAPTPKKEKATPTPKKAAAPATPARKEDATPKKEAKKAAAQADEGAPA